MTQPPTPADRAYAASQPYLPDGSPNPYQTISPRPEHLWACGCLRNEAGAHRGACPSPNAESVAMHVGSAACPDCQRQWPEQFAAFPTICEHRTWEDGGPPMSVDFTSPAYRAAMDRGAVAAIDAITVQAHSLDDLDPADAVYRLTLALDGSRASRSELAAVAAALAVHVVRGPQ